jgi:phosphinothricin acetyltransferase
LAIRAATEDDAQVIASIYNHFIERTTITFEEIPISAKDVVIRLRSVAALGLPWLVWDNVEANGIPTVRAYAYAGKFRERASYRFTVETAIYVDSGFAGKGIGRPLYQSLIHELKNRKMNRAVAGIALPNDLSVKFHEQFGFKHVGTFTQVGWKFDQWIDVGFWELDLSGTL